MEQITGAGKASRADASISPTHLLGLVRKELQDSKLTDQSVLRAGELMARFCSFVEKGSGLRTVAQIAEEHVEGFVFASIMSVGGKRRPAVATMHLRRSAVRLYFRTTRALGVTSFDPTLDLALPARSALALRALTDDEVALCRSSALGDLSATARVAAWALAEASARSSEIAKARVGDLDLEAGGVRLAGSAKVEARVGLLTPWGREQLRRRVRVLGDDPDTRLVYRAQGDAISAQASVCNAISELMRRAGLGDEPDLKPASVAAWVGTRVYEDTHDIGEVARRLGMRSLDRAALLIGYDFTASGSGGTRAG
ncbi:MAG: hypothetical protein ACR2KQ_08455 [Actinomycetota bacterium]